MKLITLATLTLTLLAPVTHAETLSVEQILVKYKAGVVQLHENDKVFTERMSSGYGTPREDTDPKSYPAGQ